MGWGGECGDNTGEEDDVVSDEGVVVVVAAVDIAVAGIMVGDVARLSWAVAVPDGDDAWWLSAVPGGIVEVVVAIPR